MRAHLVSLYISFYFSHEIHVNNVLILLCNCMYILNKKAKLTCLSIIKLGIVEDSVIKENCLLLLEMHVIERMFAFLSHHVTFHERYQDVFPAREREGLMSFT